MKPLKILHVANRAEKACGKKFYSLPYKMNNGFVRNGHCVYWFSDRDISRAHAIIPSQKWGRGACNRKLLEVCENFRPDVVVLGHADLITNDTLAEIKAKYGTVLAQYNIDLLHNGNVAKLINRNGIIDHNFITTGGSVLKKLASKGTTYSYMPNPVDRSIERFENFNKISLPIDVFFAGQISDMVDSSDLRSQISSLPTDLPQANIGLYNGVWGDTYLKLLQQAKIGLSISVGLKGGEQGDGSPHYLYSSDRISQYLGNGLLTFVEKKFDLSDVYGPGCLVEVDSYDDLKDKINFYVGRDDLRRKQAENAYRLAHEQFNERLVTQCLLETATAAPHAYSYRWPLELCG